MELIKVSFWMSHTRPSLTLHSVSSSGSVTKEKDLKSATRKYDSRLDESDQTRRIERPRDCVLLDRR